MPHEIEGEPAFPIYSVSFKFHHPIADPEKVKDYGPCWFEGLPAGRMWNGASMEWMAREEQSVENVIAELSPPTLKTMTEKHPGLEWLGSLGYGATVRDLVPRLVQSSHLRSRSGRPGGARQLRAVHQPHAASDRPGRAAIPDGG